MDDEVMKNLTEDAKHYAVDASQRIRNVTQNYSPYLQTKIRQALQEFAALLPDSLTDIQKTALLYQCIAAEGVYSSQPFRPVNYTLLGALRDRDAVCQGYADLMTLLLSAVVGCKVYTVTGYTKPDIRQVNPEESGHAWNLVVFSDGSAYHLDVTWDLKNISSGHAPRWFLRSDSEMKRVWLRSKYPAAPWKFTGKMYQNQQILSLLRQRYRSLKSRFAQGMYGLPQYSPEESSRAG